MPALLHPGVYVREIPSGTRTIEGVPTSVTIFVGETERGPLEVTRINGRTEYTRLFGRYRRRRNGLTEPNSERLLMPYALDGFYSNGGTSAYILRLYNRTEVITDLEAPDPATAVRSELGGGAEFLEASSPGAWGNNIHVVTALSTDGDTNRLRLAVFYMSPGSTTAELVEEWNRLSDDPDDENYIVDVLRRSSYIRWRTGAPLSDFPTTRENSDSAPFPTAAALGTATNLTNGIFSGGSGGDGDFTDDLNVFLTDQLLGVDDASLLVAASSRMLPDAPSEFSDDEFINFQNAFIGYADNNRPQRDLFFIGDLPSLRTFADPITEASGLGSGLTSTVTSTEYNAVYWPHIEVSDPDPMAVGRDPTIIIPPAGYVAGIYARTDGRRGVWKSPAGTEAQISGVQAFSFEVLDVHQDTLNPRAVNALRRIPAGPIPSLVIWGARTRQPSSEWRYIPVRRTAIFLRKSIYTSIQWAVFEPNDYRLWQTLRNTIGAFMEIQFRNGAFAGETSRVAYFVKVDAETTTPDDQAAGIVNILVGFAPLRPAEFVVVSLQQMAGRSR